VIGSGEGVAGKKDETRDDGGREVIKMLVVSKMIGNMIEKS